MATMLLVLPGSAFACDACYGDTSGDRQGYAATVGIFAMVVIMFVMLGAVVGFGFYLNYRAKHPLPDYSELINDDPAQPNPGTTP
jgi:threonine/homoserine/homoserine lactone efflux protein